ncbi:TetR/AcrR family transcriptional regulator [Clostridiaceae bacterium HSG29]|nr:TetR/AcrR family transcriptional regulator [Clostridiaceae bacterium HSG29]
MKSIIKRKESIIITTIDLMNEIGMYAVTTKKIAERENVSEAAIFKYFKSKSELQIAVLDFYAKYDADIVNSIIINKMKTREAILYYFKMHFTYYNNYKNITVISEALYQLRYDKKLVDKADEIINNRFNFINSLITTAQENSKISANYDATILVNLLLGTTNNICLRWRMENYKFSLSEKIEEAVKLILNSILL